MRLNILTRKTLGGLETDLDGRVPARGRRRRCPGLYAAGEVSGFGGGGMMGYNALEGTFLGGCLFSGRTAGRAAAAQVGWRATAQSGGAAEQSLALGRLDEDVGAHRRTAPRAGSSGR